MADTPIIDLLADAAARGVQVTIITNGHNPPPLTLKWTHEDRWWGAVSKYAGAGYSLSVADYDGDRSGWRLRRHGTVIAEGEDHGDRPYYHFDACLLAAEAALRADVRRRITALRGSR